MLIGLTVKLIGFLSNISFTKKAYFFGIHLMLCTKKGRPKVALRLCDRAFAVSRVNQLRQVYGAGIVTSVTGAVREAPWVVSLATEESTKP